MPGEGKPKTWEATGTFEYPQPTDASPDRQSAFRFTNTGDTQDPGESSLDLTRYEDRTGFGEPRNTLSAEEQRSVDDLVAKGYSLAVAMDVIMVDRAIG